MTESEFLEIIKEIEMFYEKEYTTSQTKYIYEELKRITKARFRQVMRQAFRSCKFMPKLADLIDIERELPKEIVNKTDERVECSRCKGTGMVLYEKPIQDCTKVRNYIFTARCNCANAVGISQLIPLADEIGV